MTPDQIAIIHALGRCSMIPGTGKKRFIRDMGSLAGFDPDRALTLKQEA
jgi:hypothetical protein